MTKELVIITGSSSGIGRATKELFAAEGHPLLLISRREGIDVTDRAAVEEAVQAAEAEHGPAGCVVNNAGAMLLGEVATQDPTEWDRMIEVNITGVLNGIRATLPGMIERKQGTLIQVSSIAGRITFPFHAVYSATKFAIHGLTETLAKEVAPHGVRCVTIAPGVVETELLDHTTDEKIKAGYSHFKRGVGKVLDPEDVARSIWFAYSQPPHVCIREILLTPTRQG